MQSKLLTVSCKKAIICFSSQLAFFLILSCAHGSNPSRPVHHFKLSRTQVKSKKIVVPRSITKINALTINAPTVCAYPPSAGELKGHGGFIMAMCVDLSNRTWIGTEEDGLYCYDPLQPTENRWKHYTTADGLGDNTVNALCCDREGRIWAGSDRTGVSIFNGQVCQNYDQVRGPIGGHVYAIGISPTTGDVWIATEGGLTRYEDISDRWDDFVAPNGVLLTQVTCLTFNKFGDVVVGTEASGVIVGIAKGKFKTWQQVPSPAAPPQSPAGDGLPSRQINCLVSRHDGLICAGTHDGLAASLDGGFHWSYSRGADYFDKIKGLYTNRVYQPTISGLELMTPEVYHELMAFASEAKTSASKAKTVSQVAPTWLAVPADYPKDQLGVRVTCVGGDVSQADRDVDRSHLVYPAPQAVYNTERQGESTFNLSNLTPNASYELRLHFSEFDYSGPGQRIFSVLANSQPIIQNLDICAATGSKHTALIKDIPVTADAQGGLKIQFIAPIGQTAQIAALAAMQPSNLQQLMSEDYVSCLAFSPDNKLYIGHWTKGIECLDLRQKKFVAVNETDETGTAGSKLDFVESLLPTYNGDALVGGYGGQIHTASVSQSGVPGSVSQSSYALRSDVQPIGATRFPSPAKSPTDAELSEIDNQISNSSLQAMKPGEGAYLGADWATRGDWVGRYGTRLAILCAASAPFNHEIMNDWTYKYSYDLGPNRMAGDATRHWIQWLHTDDPRVLFSPILGFRREAEWDDHGEAYSMSAEGPDLWVSVYVPAGTHRLAGYFVNKDGHDGSNRDRDYLIDLLPWRSDVRDAWNLKPLASARVRKFWSGVYQSFVVCGPSKFYLHISRNNSLNTIISGIMIDKLTGPPTPLEGVQCTFCKSAQYAAYVRTPDVAKAENSRTAGSEETRKLWFDLYEASGKKMLAGAAVADRVLCYRSLVSETATSADKEPCTQLMAWWRRSIPLQTEDDRNAFLPAMKDIYTGETLAYPTIKDIH